MDKRQTYRALLKELRRWVFPLHQGAGLRRWSAWTQALLRRHGRIARSYRLLDMALLVRPAPLIQRLRQQWLTVSTQYFPRLQLAIQSIIQHTVWRDLTRPSVLRVINAPAQGKVISSEYFEYLPGHEKRFLAPTAIANPVGIVPADTRKLAAMCDARSSSGFIHESTVYRPLQLVFQRLRQTDELEVCHRRHALVCWETLRTQAREVMRRTQRFEHRIAETVARTTRKLLPLGAQDAVSAPARAAQMSVSVPAGSGMPPNPWPPSSAPTLNIEQLADQVVRQIDRRIIAARERMGRI